MRKKRKKFNEIITTKEKKRTKLLVFVVFAVGHGAEKRKRKLVKLGEDIRLLF